MQPGYRFQYQVPPKSPAFSTIRKSVIPCLPRSIAVSIPAKPPPTIDDGGLLDHRVPGEAGLDERVPVELLVLSSRHWAMPSGRRRFCCSCRYRWRSSSIEALCALVLFHHSRSSLRTASADSVKQRDASGTSSVPRFLDGPIVAATSDWALQRKREKRLDWLHQDFLQV